MLPDLGHALDRGCVILRRNGPVEEIVCRLVDPPQLIDRVQVLLDNFVSRLESDLPDDGDVELLPGLADGARSDAEIFSALRARFA